MVLSIAGQHSLQLLGHQCLHARNSRCRLEKHLSFGPNSQCGNCYKFRHPHYDAPRQETRPWSLSEGACRQIPHLPGR